MSAPALTLAIGAYDHVRDLATGAVRPNGIDLHVVHLPVEEVFHRFIHFREWHVSEMSFAKYAAMVSQGDASLVALPVFPSRVFRHSSIYVRRGSPLRALSELRGKRIGLPEWAQTAAVYTRGILVHEAGVPLADVEWHQAGVNEPGRKEKVAISLPPGVRLARHEERTLNDLLLAGDIDAAFSARQPAALATGGIVRLLDDPRAAEEAWFRATGIFPIMHVVCMRRDVFETHPWTATNLVEAFDAAKRASLARLGEIAASHVPLPWLYDDVRRARAAFGDDFWPYGIEPNRRTLEAFLQFAAEQGVTQRHVSVEELFPPEVQSRVRV
jgi:4,5-dihydroxyphthalate decarboxylase